MVSESIKKKILVVDDERSTTLSIASYLKNFAADYELIRAFTKDEAMVNIKTHKPHVVLLDIELNGVNAGISILDYLNHEYKDIKTIVISGKAKHLKEQLEEMGCYHFFSKPVEITELNNKIKDALGIEKVTIEEHISVKGRPKARLLFIEPDWIHFAYLASIFDPSAKEMLNGADYEIKVIIDVGDVLDTCATFQPDIVLIGDYSVDADRLLNLVKLVKENIKIKPKAVFVHGLFERGQIFELKLAHMGVKRCIQNVLNQDQLLEMHRMLSNKVDEECIKQRLVHDERKNS